MKKLGLLFFSFFMIFSVYAQSDDDLFFDDFDTDDEMLFGDDIFGTATDDDLFSDDDLFFDDGIDEVTSVKASSDLSKGVLFENGSIKIGGNFTTGINTSTVLYNSSSDDFATHLKNTTLTPNVSATLSVDARPSQELRMYTKFALDYPFSIAATSTANQYTNTISTTVNDWISLKELFTDFSIADTAFFRFGYHTVTWGTGYFFSPISDIINTSSINPEDVDAQVNGSLNLRTQIIIPQTQNCLWLYVIPSTDFGDSYTFQAEARKTAFAGKFDLVLGGWELGFGGYWKYEAAPKVTLTATGSVKKFNLFAEGVYQYGSDREWTEDSSKSHLFKATAGFSYMWKDPSILLAAQYYYDGNNFTLKDTASLMYLLSNPLYIKDDLTQGHNIAAMVNFGRIFGTTDVTATVFGMVNFGKEELSANITQMLESYGAASLINAGTFSAMIYYSPKTSIKMGIGPYLTFADWDEKPELSLKINFSLGGGKF